MCFWFILPYAVSLNNRVQNALLALRQLLKKFEYKATGSRDVIHDIIEQVFPLLQTLMVSLMPNTSEEASTVIKLILKVS